MSLLVPSDFLAHWAKTHDIEEAKAAFEFMRPEDEVMTPSTLRAMTPNSLSFSSSLIERMQSKEWNITRLEMNVGADGHGHGIYEIDAEGHVFHFAFRAQPSAEGPGEGRLRESEYDFLGTLIDGPPDRDYIARDLDEMVAKVWRGRSTCRTFGWTFSNRSATNFAAVVDALAAGEQPDITSLQRTGGYILRNAGFYGNGRHASRAWLTIPDDHPLSHPYHVDLICLYLWRLVGFEIVEAIAAARSSRAVQIAPSTKRSLGIGNSSGIGTVAALVRWPTTLSAIIFSREFVLGYAKSRQGPARLRDVEIVSARIDDAIERYSALNDREFGFESPPTVVAALAEAKAALQNLTARAESVRSPWAWLAAKIAESGSAEAVENVNAFLIDLYPEVVASLNAFMRELMLVPRSTDPTATVAETLSVLEDRYHWALEVDVDAPGARQHFWYKSDENGENRRGVRSIDPGVELETFVDVAGAAQELHTALRAVEPSWRIGRFLLHSPQQAMMASRVNIAVRFPYSELRFNVLDVSFHPIDVIRCFLSALGLSRADPASALWLRGVFFEDAPVVLSTAEGY